MLAFLLNFPMSFPFNLYDICPSHFAALCFSIQFRLHSRISITYFYFYHIIEWNTSNFNWLDWKQTMVVFPDILASYQFPQPFSWCPAVAVAAAVIWFRCIWLVVVVVATFIILRICAVVSIFECIRNLFVIHSFMVIAGDGCCTFYDSIFLCYKCMLHSEHDWLAHATYASFLWPSFIPFHFILFFFFVRWFVDCHLGSNNEADIPHINKMYRTQLTAKNRRFFTRNGSRVRLIVYVIKCYSVVEAFVSKF